MSRATRPLRRVRGAELDQLQQATWSTRYAADPTRPWSLRPNLILVTARRIGCRPSHLRRCLLGRVVSARAAGRILLAARGR